MGSASTLKCFLRSAAAPAPITRACVASIRNGSCRCCAFGVMVLNGNFRHSMPPSKLSRNRWIATLRRPAEQLSTSSRWSCGRVSRASELSSLKPKLLCCLPQTHPIDDDHLQDALVVTFKTVAKACSPCSRPPSVRPSPSLALCRRVGRR